MGVDDNLWIAILRVVTSDGWQDLLSIFSQVKRWTMRTLAIDKPWGCHYLCSQWQQAWYNTCERYWGENESLEGAMNPGWEGCITSLKMCHKYLTNRTKQKGGLYGDSIAITRDSLWMFNTQQWAFYISTSEYYCMYYQQQYTVQCSSYYLKIRTAIKQSENKH